MPARAGLRKLRSPAINQGLHRHTRIGQKARKSDNPTALATRQTPQTGARARHHFREQQTPLFARRSSPKSPNPQPSEVTTSRTPFKVGQSNHAKQNPSSARQGKPFLKMCASLSACAGGCQLTGRVDHSAATAFTSASAFRVKSKVKCKSVPMPSGAGRNLPIRLSFTANTLSSCSQSLSAS
jgi:hypothetical protein